MSNSLMLISNQLLKPWGHIPLFDASKGFLLAFVFEAFKFYFWASNLVWPFARSRLTWWHSCVVTSGINLVIWDLMRRMHIADYFPILYTWRKVQTFEFKNRLTFAEACKLRGGLVRGWFHVLIRIARGCGRVGETKASWLGVNYARCGRSWRYLLWKTRFRHPVVPLTDTFSIRILLDSMRNLGLIPKVSKAVSETTYHWGDPWPLEYGRVTWDLKGNILLPDLAGLSDAVWLH